MIGGSRRVEAEVKMEQAWMPVGEIPVGGGDIAQVAAPVFGGLRQLDSGKARSAIRRNNSSFEPK